MHRRSGNRNDLKGRVPKNAIICLSNEKSYVLTFHPIKVEGEKNLIIRFCFTREGEHVTTITLLIIHID